MNRPPNPGKPGPSHKPRNRLDYRRADWEKLVRRVPKEQEALLKKQAAEFAKEIAGQANSALSDFLLKKCRKLLPGEMEQCSFRRKNGVAVLYSISRTENGFRFYLNEGKRGAAK